MELREYWSIIRRHWWLPAASAEDQRGLRRLVAQVGNRECDQDGGGRRQRQDVTRLTQVGKDVNA